VTEPKTFLQRIDERDAPPPPTPIRRTDNEHVNGTNGTAYTYAAVRDEIDALAAATSGHQGGKGRNNTLNIAALKLARLPIDRDTLRKALTQACHTNGLIADKGMRGVEATINSAFDKADRDGPRVIPEPTVNPARPEVVPARVNGTTATVEVVEPESHPIWGSRPPADGAAYLFDHDDTAVSLWGHDDLILWAEGEALMIAGGMGLGKTTLAGQMVRAQIGLDDDVLGMPVTTVDGPILYLAMDRPRQIRRSMLRQFDATERDLIAGRLLIRPGPPIADLAVRPALLAEMAAECGATVVYIDSLKDAAIGLSSDEVGAAYNRSRQYALASGVQVCELHHLIKRNPLGGAPNTVADVYGSNWLTAGAGSVVMLTGEPGDPIVGFRHAKQPHAEVGPWRLLHDPQRGRFSIDHETDLLAIAAAAGANGLTPAGAACAIFEKDKPSRAQIEKARRRLDKLVTSGHLTRIEGIKGGADGGISANYFTAS
jgi:hypothetical protein